MSEETEKTKMTKEEFANKVREYYDRLEKIYPLDKFEIKGRNEEKLHFCHGFNSALDEELLIYYLFDEEDEKYLEKEKTLHLQGEEMPEDKKRKIKSQGFITINREEKFFNFGVEREHRGKGYGKSIYYNIPNILEMLSIENKEQYEIRVYGGSDHDFLKRIETEKLVAKASGELNNEKALQIIEEFAKYPNTMKIIEFNTIIEYALNSNVPMEKISEAINDNGFNIFYATVNYIPDFEFEKDDFDKFKSFGITGIKPTCMHRHFRGNFGFMKLFDDVDMEDATLEFKRIFEEVKEKKGEYRLPNLEKFGELEHIILDWDYSGLLFKHVSPEIRELVKKQAITKFDEFDSEHKAYWEYGLDYNSAQTLKMLRDAGLMDKDTYIALYQKALNRNYDLDEFDYAISHYIDKEQREKAKQEIAKNVYYPCPKGKWQRSRSWEGNHRISKVAIPQKISKNNDKYEVRDILKKEILRQGIAKKTKIKTDMIGKSKDGKTFVVNNLQDWLFGVPGAYGNLNMMGTNAVTFPPQTPKFAIDLVEKAFKEIEDPDRGGRE